MSELNSKSAKISKVTNAAPSDIARFILGEMAGPYAGYIGPQGKYAKDNCGSKGVAVSR